MKINQGFFKIIHEFPYAQTASLEEKLSVVRQTLETVRENGYDGIVSNVDWTDEYLQNEEHWQILREKARLCREMGLRLWIYDERGYPSGAAGTLTLDENPALEAKALSAVYKILNPGQREAIPLPYGHLKHMAAFGFFFDGETVSHEDLRQQPIRIPFSQEGYVFENDTDRKLLCLAFFTKPAFEGTHCQHNAFSVRRYIDIANPLSGKALIDNTYRRYADVLGEYLEDGTVEAFFTDEPSYMAVYFNLKKQCAVTTHIPDPKLPLWAMVNWSDALPEVFAETYGYRIEDCLPWLFLGNDRAHQKVRRDFYTLLTELAEHSFFEPISEFCQANRTRASGHILLEEKITDHPLYEGNFFSLLRHMQIPGMDMLDSIPERVWKKAFTPLLVSSVSKLYADGMVMDEVSLHFQAKFGVSVSSQQLLNSLLMQYALGANLFTSYYSDEDLLQKIPTGETVLAAVKRVMQCMDNSALRPSVALYYPIEAVMANTVSPVDIAHVYDSSRLKEYRIPYPINRADLDKNDLPTPVVVNDSERMVVKIEQEMEQCSFALLNRQIPFVFCDTDSIERLKTAMPKLFVISAHEPTEELLARIPTLSRMGCRVVAVTGNGMFSDCYRDVADDVTLVDGIAELIDVFGAHSLLKTAGENEGIVALWSQSKLLLINSEQKAKRFRLQTAVTSVTDCYTNRPVSFEPGDNGADFPVPPYGVLLVQ